MPTSPERSLRLHNIGGDPASPRYVIINVDGPSQIRARLSQVSGGSMRVCIRRESDLDDGACGLRSFSWTTTDAGRADWKIELIARPGNPNPNGTLTITFNSLAPSATLNSFRFNGTGDPTRNGFTAEFATLADGEMAIRGNFEDNSFNYQLVIQPCSEAVCNQTSSGHNFQAMLAGSAGTAYTVSVFSPDETTTAGGPAFVQSTISWH